MDISVRREERKDYRIVEEITREAFWNLYVPGCNEHLLAHKLRMCPDFIPELDFVAEKNGRVAGNIMFSRCSVIDVSKKRHELIMFGPVSVLPELQRRGIGDILIRHALRAAADIGHKAVAIYGSPDYYPKFGFRNGKEFGIGNPDGRYPIALQVLELAEGALKSISGQLHESSIFTELGEDELEIFDAAFPPKKKQVTPSQKHFAETSNTYLD